jgi:class II flagellar assembly regulator FliX
MRIHGPNGPGVVSNTSQTRRTGPSTFTLDAKDNTRPASSAGAAKSLGGIDALLALQGVEDATERRRRAVRRGNLALDALDELKLSLLAGTLDTAMLVRLKGAVGDLAERSGEPGLDSVLAEISLRLEVELAKLGAPERAGPGAG